MSKTNKKSIDEITTKLNVGKTIKENNTHYHKAKIPLIVCGSLFIIALIIINFKPFAKIQSKAYSVRGIDVSHHQGDVNWKQVLEEDIDFVYIKATEGSSYVDECFEKNKEALSSERFAFGMYHFFSFDSSPEKQAKHFIKTVGDLKGHLVPVVDVEYYGKYQKNPPKKEEVRKTVQTMLDLLEEEYNVKPMIYSTTPFYNKYLNGKFDDYPLWIRNVYFKPPYDWTIWQYTDHLKLDGINGKEKYVDCNVFNDRLERYIIK